LSAMEVHEWAPVPRPPEALLASLPAGGRALLESAGGPADLRRWSVVAAEPVARLVAWGERVVWWEAGRGWRRRRGDPLALLAAEVTARAAGAHPAVPLLGGGAIVAFGYDLGRRFERLPARAVDPQRWPDVDALLYDTVAVVDHAAECLRVAGPRARAWLARWRAATLPPPPSPPSPPGPVRRGFDRAGYEAAVRRVLAYIAAGDVFQVNLSQRFAVPAREPAWALYRRLRVRSPAPFAAYLELAAGALVAASPERFLARCGDRVETRPIKGTRPRGTTPAEDAAASAALWASAKDEAELRMIVDVARNDLGRVAQVGTVRVPELRRLEAHATVFHTVARVEARLRPGVGLPELLAATFPGASVTGAPKIRAMEILDELEPVRRGPYCGAFGYLDAAGRLDLAMAIRILWVRRGWVHWQVGGGVVADSDPAAEYEETLAKGRALAAALGVEVR